MPFSKYGQYGLSLYSKSGRPVTDRDGKVQPASIVVHNEGDEKKFRDLGYSEQYVEQEFPKAIAHNESTGEAHVTHVAQNAQHQRQIEKALAAKDEPGETK